MTDDSKLFTESNLEAGDYVVIVIYFLSVLAVGIWSSWRSRKQSEEGSDQVGEYFLASRNTHFILVGASIFVSNIGSEHFIGLAGSGAASGIGVASYEINAIFILMLLAWFFVPVYIVSGIYTMPEYMRTRFGGQRIRILLSSLAMLSYVFTKISADLYAGALFIKLAVGLEGLEGLYVSILILLAFAAFFTIFGGLAAVLWTDFIQAIIMVIGAFVLMGITLVKVGGIPTIFDEYSKSEPSGDYVGYDYDPETGTNVTCGTVRDDFAHFFRDPVTGDYPWTGVFTGMIISSIWFWCTDQVIVQRTLSAKNLSHAKIGCIIAAYLKLLPFFLIVIPGMAARILWPNLVACSNPEKCTEICGSAGGCSNISYVLLVLRLLPQGIRGLMLAVMLAALMSSLTSIFNSASTIFTMDIWKLIRKSASDLELIIVGRCTVLFLVVVSILWIPVILSFKDPQLFNYIQAISAYFAPPITAVFLSALLWHRMTEPSAFWGMLSGFILGIIRFCLEFGVTKPHCGTGEPDLRPEWIKHAVGNFNFLHFSPVSFIFTLIIIFIVSMITDPIGEEYLYRLTFWTRKKTSKRIPLTEESHEDPKNTQGKTHSKMLYKLCCVTQAQEKQEEEGIHSAKTEEELIKESVELLNESGTLKSASAISAMILLSVASFIWGYFA